jgi:hypothetical protein
MGMLSGDEKAQPVFTFVCRTKKSGNMSGLVAVTAGVPMPQGRPLPSSAPMC